MMLPLLNLALAGYMAGLGWLVERVVYPQLAAVPAGAWRAWHAAHSRRITPVVAPPMLALPVVAAALVLRPGDAPGVAVALNLVLAAVPLAVTALVFAPLHARLAGGAAPDALARLARLNRLRTAAWTAHLAVALWVAATWT